MTFLKKLGLFLLNFAKVEVPEIGMVASLVSPLLGTSKVGKLVQTAVSDLTLMGTQVVTIETALSGKTGTDKLAAVVPLIGNVIRTSELVAGRKIQHEELFTKAVQGYAQATVDLLNSIHPDEVK